MQFYRSTFSARYGQVLILIDRFSEGRGKGDEEAICDYSRPQNSLYTIAS